MLVGLEASVERRNEQVDGELGNGPARHGEFGDRPDVAVAAGGGVPVVEEALMDDAGAGEFGGDGGVGVVGVADIDPRYR
jgi:hypothetical protein